MSFSAEADEVTALANLDWPQLVQSQQSCQDNTCQLSWHYQGNSPSAEQLKRLFAALAPYREGPLVIEDDPIARQLHVTLQFDADAQRPLLSNVAN
ncbi:hypothetical protein [Ferrimonas pelagia]